MRRVRWCAALAALCLAIPGAARAVLALARTADLADLPPLQIARLFLTGLRLDGVIAGSIVLPVAALLLLCPERWLARAFAWLRLHAALVFFALCAAEIVGFYFFRYYDMRLNYQVIDHAASPEVIETVLAAYPVAGGVALALAGALLGVWLLQRCARGSRAPARGGAALADRAGALLFVLLAGLAMRGTLDHRPLNPSLAAFSANRVANELAGSGVLNLATEGLQRRGGVYRPLAAVAPALAPEDALRRARARLASGAGWLDAAPSPLARRILAPARERPLHVVLVVMESFTARLVGALGGSPALSPELDQLAREGVLFENCFATGERTVQGLEAILSSFPSLPGVSAIRRPQARQGFETLATPLRARGYDTLFLYGGQGIFDDMRGFFVGNGFDVFLEERDFENPVFRGAWGVSDEDVFRRALDEIGRRHAAGRPSLAVILTISLHSPWEFPPGRSGKLPADTPVPPGYERAELENFLYADWALGELVREARSRPFFDDTLFVLAGDHGVHLRGRELVPIDENRVPVLFYAPARLAPRRIARVTSQLDVAPTVLGILGGDYTSTFFGEDVLAHPEAEGFAPMVYDRKRLGLRRGPRLGVFLENGRELAFERGPDGAGWQPAPLTPERREEHRDGVALLQLAETLLLEGRYRSAAD
jgi:phosphoglycerol transferase MdoB-like AlkP superfamily enzyme